jgi:hypothetical protein
VGLLNNLCVIKRQRRRYLKRRKNTYEVPADFEGDAIVKGGLMGLLDTIVWFLVYNLCFNQG